MTDGESLIFATQIVFSAVLGIKIEYHGSRRKDSEILALLLILLVGIVAFGIACVRVWS